ncbi:MAG TPA: hypothetical protein VH815_15670, partial [Acidobacteriota bacterium]
MDDNERKKETEVHKVTITSQSLSDRPADSADYRTITRKIKKLPKTKQIAMSKALSKVQGSIVKQALNLHPAARRAIQNDIADLI